MIREVAIVSNTISRAVDFWVDSILQGYMTEFLVEVITSYSEAHFFSKALKKISVIHQYMDQDACV